MAQMKQHCKRGDLYLLQGLHRLLSPWNKKETEKVFLFQIVFNGEDLSFFSHAEIQLFAALVGTEDNDN